MEIIQKYCSGEIDSPDVVLLLGKTWNANRVVCWLEEKEAYRPLSLQRVPPEVEVYVLRRLIEIRDSDMIQDFNNKEWIHREVVASQRLAGIYLEPRDDLFLP